MSRVFNANLSNYMSAGSALVTAYPFTIAGWFKTGDIATAQTIWSAADAASDDEDWFLGMHSDATITSRVKAGGGGFSSFTAGTVSANTWVHVAGVFASASSRTPYLNGTAGTTETTAVTPSNLDNFIFGQLRRLNPAQPVDGKLGYWGLWNNALSGANITSLAGGALPSAVSSGTLVSWWRMLGTASPETDHQSSNDLTITGTVTGDTGDNPISEGGGGSDHNSLTLLGVG